MNQPLSRRAVLRAASACAASAFITPALASRSKPITFRKTVLDTRYVAEGVAVGDVDRDGNLDIIAGNVWYKAPDWTPREIAPIKAVDATKAYSNCFNSWMVDLNHDGWLDQLVIGMPGERAFWRENPRGADTPWKEHPVWRSACNESPLYVDLFRNGKRVLVMGYDDDKMAWFEPARDPYAEWICHDLIPSPPVPGTHPAVDPGSPRYSHGLGVGDINGDGRNEIIIREGFYVMPGDPRRQAWKFVKTDLGPECAQMAVIDINRDGRADIVSSSAHNRGVWWYEQLPGGGFRQHVIDDRISETHSLVVTNLGHRGSVNAVTGKRFYAHPPGVDVGSEEPALLVRYELQPGLTWERHVIDENSGVGTQFVVQDVTGNGLADIVVSNKKGVFLFEQQ
jgi:hypothetical protein